ncbi:ThuA domain-containing protein [Paenibacillus nasutitermitis]|uniref:ThuA-like domain-containing protein n=1 Tax=Paenibacillus nasutitermitis TaxID=1652958 RepID=A0A916Z6W8_9BACL|nr:ThuA domain-containing protein [Paenibacillus nasutitermitis]GGD79602.1 hypothetical protein GCM10010911_42110 [Paenibacillus nasutitermitis]
MIKASTKKIVLIAGELSHGPGAHEYIKTVRLLKVMLEQSTAGGQLQVEYHLGGWPEDPQTLEDADLVLFATDGRDGHLYQDVPFVATPERLLLMERLMERGCGLVLLHFSTFFTREEGKKVLQWGGGYYEWEDERGERNWYSRISDGDRLELATAVHPIASGVGSTIELKDEIYWKLRFLPDDPRRTPIWQVPGLAEEGDPLANQVGWALQRDDGGRAFVTTAGHLYSLWENDDFRKVHLNAIVWAAGLPVATGGVQSRFYTDDMVDHALEGVKGTERSSIPDSIHVLLLSGNEHHKWHNWEQTAPAIRAAIQQDERITVTESTDIEALSDWDLSVFHVIALNYCNWQDPNGLSERAKEGLLSYLRKGGGLLVLHFANGAFHFSLPEAGASDWPEFQRVVPRAWNHHGSSGHDPYGSFDVRIVDPEHATTRGIAGFTVTDELYFNQEGTANIHVLYAAQSKVTGKEEPLAWTSEYEGARVYQTLLGHDGEAYKVSEVQEMLRRAVRWSCGK